MIKRKISVIALWLFITIAPFVKAATPDEGMWLMMLVERLNYAEMKTMGCNLTPEEIYSVNKSSLKDAVVQLGGFCTAEVISDQGLLLTNHHCAYDAIQGFSSTQHDYLTDGFWTKNRSEERNVPGLTVSFLIRMEDVTARVLEAGADGDQDERDMRISEAIFEIEEEASEGSRYRVQVKDMFYGNEFYLFVYETFRDVRLVGAPPSSIGKFGGDTDNWMWPRHTGDFALLRIYAGADNEPADYSEDNKPYTPKHFLPVSIRGVKEGDFTMIMGFPGSTDRWLTSYAIDQTFEQSNPDVIRILGSKLGVMDEEMAKDPNVRIKLASNYASLSNYHKYCVGQNLGLSHRGLSDEKRTAENKFSNWVNADQTRKAEYGHVLNDIKSNYESNRALNRLSTYLNMAGFGTQMVSNGLPLWRLLNRMETSDDASEWQGRVDMLKAGQEASFKDFDWMTDKKVFAALMRLMYNDLPESQRLSVFASKAFLKLKPSGDRDRFDLYADYVYDKSIIVDRDRMNAFLAKPTLKGLQGDPGLQVVVSVIDLYRSNQEANGGFDSADEKLMNKYVQGVRQMDPSRVVYPDANSTLRLTYGTVKAYEPRDAVYYKYRTTTKGLVEKDLDGDEEFDVPDKLITMIREKDFGRYADKSGEMPVCFLANLDITGGNSGSPVIDGNGHLVGTAFDGNWESMTSDLVFDDDVVRTISVDIRYTLWVIDKFAGAVHLINEMKIIE